MTDRLPLSPAPTPPSRPDAVGDAGAPIPRAALERVLARASELQLAGSEAPETVSEARLLEIGREVGLDPDALRQAIAEERIRPLVAAEEPGRLENALGAAVVGTQRTIGGTPEALLGQLDGWMQKREGMQHRRRAGSRWSWEPRRDPFQSIATAFSGRSDLAGADEVAAAITAVDGARSAVRLDASLHRLRRSQRTTVVFAWVLNAVVALGWAVPVSVLALAEGLAGWAAVLLPFAGLAALAVHGAVGWWSWRAIRAAYRRALGRAELRLEQLLDALEQGERGAPPTLLDQLRQGIAKLESSL